MTIVFLGRTNQPHTSYYTFALIISVLAVFQAIAYAPWMASFTETVERRNPALAAHGLAVWGWIIRAVVAVSIFAIPLVVTSVTPLVQYGTQVQAITTKYATELATLKAIDPATLATLSAQPTNPVAAAKAVGEIVQAQHVTPAVALQRLVATATVPKADLAFLQAHGAAVQKAAVDTPKQWRTWWWVCVAGEVIFLPFILLMSGRWSPRRARKDLEEHEQAVQQELAMLKP